MNEVNVYLLCLLTNALLLYRDETPTKFEINLTIVIIVVVLCGLISNIGIVMISYTKRIIIKIRNKVYLTNRRVLRWDKVADHKCKCKCTTCLESKCQRELRQD